ncbi:hypothetical protein [Streptomyces sp. NPDC005283]|uniref:hypothetical protein n=1 Tax=Streptomyces sp. NPDC005283 TaxID=3156871 RepID=UPI003454D476
MRQPRMRQALVGVVTFALTVLGVRRSRWQRTSPWRPRWSDLPDRHARADQGHGGRRDTEHGTSTEDPNIFQPAELNTGQWAAALKIAGFRPVILTSTTTGSCSRRPTCTKPKRAADTPTTALPVLGRRNTDGTSKGSVLPWTPAECDASITADGWIWPTSAMTPWSTATWTPRASRLADTGAMVLGLGGAKTFDVIAMDGHERRHRTDLR